MQLPRPLRGIVPPLVTPLRNYDTLDPAGLERLVDSLLEGGVRGIFVLGTTGEAASLSHRVRREVIERVCRHAGGRVPVLAGVSDTSVEESLRLAEYAALCGAAAVVMTAPYYYHLAQHEMLSFLERVSGEFPLPLFLYDMPHHVRFCFDARTVRLAADLPNISGVKDSTGDLNHFVELRDALADKPDFSMLIGPEQLLLAAMALGAHGGVCGGANLYPELYVRLYDTVVAGDQEEADRLQAIVQRICNEVYGVASEESSYLRAIKCALALKGICTDVVAEPYTSLDEPDRTKIRECLLDLGILTQPVGS